MKSGRACSTIRPEHRLGERMEKDMKNTIENILAGGGGGALSRPQSGIRIWSIAIIPR